MHPNSDKMAPSTSENQISREDPVASDHRSVEVDEKNEEIGTDAQAGVRAVEAAASAWSTRHLVAAYVMSVVIYMVGESVG